MSKRFDSYHAWLGIPPSEQPPNHYRLLGISLFESDADVIQNGLDQRMSHLKSLANGAHKEESRRLLTEVSQAGVCLLRPEKKQAYDRALRSSLHANAETVEVPPAAVPVTATVTAPAAPIPKQPARQVARPVEAAIPAVTSGDAIDDENSAEGGFPIGPTIVGSAIGLGVACLVLILLAWLKSTPEKVVHLDSANQNAHGMPETPGSPDGAGDPDAVADPPEQEGHETVPVIDPPVESKPEQQPALPQPQAERNDPPPLPESPSQPAEPQSRPSWPRPLPGSPKPSSPSNSDPSETAPTTRDRSGEADAAPTFSETPKTVVLDVERSAMHVLLIENGEGKDVQTQVKGLTNLSTSYTLNPSDGIVRLGSPVDVVLSQYAGVKIRLSMDKKGQAVDLEVAPEIETDQGKTSDFSKNRLDNAKRGLMKKYTALGKQLAAAQSEALMLQNAMTRPAAAPVRNAQRQRFTVLTSQTIPALQSQVTYVQTRADVLQQLSVLAKQIHEKAELNLVVQVKDAEDAK